MSLTKLKDSMVWRGGMTARYMNRETSEVYIGNRAPSLEQYFTMSSKGGGYTDVSLRIGSKDFPSIIEQMLQIDREGVLPAIAALLAREIANQPKHNALIAHRARDSVRKLALEKYNAAPSGSDQAEKFVLDSVRKLTEELNKADQKNANAEAA